MSVPQRDHGAGLQRFLPVLLLAGLAVVFYWDSFALGRVTLMRDTFCSILRWRVFASQALHDGAVPFWNPYSLCGQAYVANPQTAVFYPLHALFYMLPANLALKVWLSLHLFIAASSMYVLARTWQLSVAPALLAGIAYGFGTHIVALLEFQAPVPGVAFAPLLIWGVEKWMTPSPQTVEISRPGSGKVAAALQAGKGYIRGVVVLTLVLATQFLAGYLQTFLNGILVAVAYVVAREVVRRDWQRLLTGITAFAFAGLLALGLCLVQFLLTWELIPMSARGHAIDPGFDEASWAPRMLLSFLLPFLAGRPGYSGGWWGDYLDLSEFWVGTAYVGLLPVLLLPVLIMRPWRYLTDREFRETTRFRVLFLTAVAVVGLLLAFGKNTPLYGLLYRFVPGFDRLRWPAKFLQLVAFALPLMAAYGLQGLLDRQIVARKHPAGVLLHFDGKSSTPVNCRGLLYWWAALLVFLLVAATAVTWNVNLYSLLAGRGFSAARQSTETLALVRNAVWESVGFTVLGIVVLAPLLARRISPRGRKLASFCVVTALFANLFLVGRELQPTASDGIYDLTPESLLAVTRVKEPGRISQDGPFADGPQWLYGNSKPAVFQFAMDASYGETSLPFHIERIWGGAVLVPAEYSHLLWRMGRQPLTTFHRQRYMDLLNVRTFISGPGGSPDILHGRKLDQLRLAVRPKPLPRALVMAGWTTVADRKEAEKLLLSPEHDPYRTVVLGAPAEGVPETVAATGADPETPITSLAEAGIAWIRYGWNRVDLLAEAKAPSMLLLNDSYYPGWLAYIDGRPASILPANLFFRAVPLPPGRHKVEFIYRPTYLTIGLCGTGISAGVLAALVLALFLRRRAQGCSSPLGSRG